MAITPLPRATPAVSWVWRAPSWTDCTRCWSARPSDELVAGVEELQRLKAAVAGSGTGRRE